MASNISPISDVNSTNEVFDDCRDRQELIQQHNNAEGSLQGIVNLEKADCN
jgi:hypothetical protein